MNANIINSQLLTVDEFLKDTNKNLIKTGAKFRINIEDVKWFFRDVDNEEAKKSKNSSYSIKWTPFDEIDSYNLELEYRNLIESNYDSNCIIQVLDGLYEVDLSKRECYSIYWEENPMNVMRSIWFNGNNEPFEEKSSNEIEKKYVELFLEPIEMPREASEEKQPGDKLQREPLCTLDIDEGTVIWYTKDEVYFEKNNMTVMDKMHLTFMKLRKKIHFDRIHRGYLCPDFTYDHATHSKEITHLVFVIHGIAQKLDRSKIYKCCDSLGKGCEKKKRELFPHCKNYKFMFLPVDWRSSLVLDNGLVDAITIKNVQSIRSKLNYSALDIMYYSSPIYKTEIMNSLSTELNRLYNKFCEKNKNFVKNNGLVSLVAHSLGAVVVYDVLTSNTRFFNNYGEDINQEKLMFNQISQNNTNLLNEYLNCKKRIQDIEIQLMKSNDNNVTPLNFKIENLFCFGSPLAVFLALRGVRPVVNGTQEHILPKSLCKHLFNIFHPSDPVAYRLEPLISTSYSNKSALDVQKSNDLTLRSSHVVYKELHHKRHRKQSSSTSKHHEETPHSKASSPSDQSSLSVSNPNLSLQNEYQELENAVDFQLQESGFELMALFTSHNCYWNNKDVALFITTQLVSNKNN